MNARSTALRAALAAGSIALALPTCAQAPEEPSAAQAVFGAGVEAVYVDVFVSSAGRPLTGLSAADFEVRDNGSLQSAELLTQEQVPTHALLLLDTSVSTAPRLEALKRAARAFLSGLRAGDKVSLLTFDHRVNARCLACDAAAARAALDQARAEGGSAVHDALYVVLGLADPREGRPVVVVFSDGDDRLSWLTADKLLGVARESDASIYAVDTSFTGPAPDLPRRAEAGNEAVADRSGFLTGSRGSLDVRQGPTSADARPPSLLQRLASETGGEVFAVTAGDLEAAFLGVLGDLKSRYVLRYQPQGGARPGWHELGVRLKGRSGDLRARKGYFAAQ
jgi:VWFA-related protein